jgi:hypothetical protein
LVINIVMSARSPLCHVCTKALNHENLTRLSHLESEVNGDLHLTSESFQLALNLKCYICSIIRDFLVAKSKAIPSTPILHMTYRLSMCTNDQEVLLLYVHLATEDGAKLFRYYPFLLVHSESANFMLLSLQHMD